MGDSIETVSGNDVSREGRAHSFSIHYGRSLRVVNLGLDRAEIPVEFGQRRNRGDIGYRGADARSLIIYEKE